ncbi:deoxynucleoside kinase [Undibacterium sp. Di24W]|uniref:deoxynucleoside kinase n=1 Tax=Undibacterium sp. Di24W TaxID=3413033 RepID=UPI003BF26AC5
MKFPFIVFEGVDGAGKSEISAAVAKRMGARHLESPTGKFKDMRNYIDETLCDKGRFLFYLASNFDLSREIREHRESELSPIICARYFYSTIIGYASKNNIDMDSICEKIPVSSIDLEAPDMTIFLDINKEAQRKRLESRDPNYISHMDFKVLNDESYQERLIANYARTCESKGWLRIDTSTMDMEGVINVCIEKIGDR